MSCEALAAGGLMRVPEGQYLPDPLATMSEMPAAADCRQFLTGTRAPEYRRQRSIVLYVCRGAAHRLRTMCCCQIRCGKRGTLRQDYTGDCTGGRRSSR